MSVSSVNSDNNSSDYESNSSLCSDINIDWKGTIIDNKYIIIHKIGSGSYCSVWLTYDFVSNREYALKIYNRDDYDDAQKEIEVFDKLKALNINNIILYDHFINYKYIDKDDDDDEDVEDDAENAEDADDDDKSTVGSTCDNPFLLLFMPLCGYSIYNILKLIGLKNCDSIFKINTNIYTSYINLVLNAVTATKDILNILHQNNFVHTDIKPENILIKKPTLECKKIIDLIKIKQKEIFNNSQIKKGLFKKKNKKNSHISELQKFIMDIDISNLNITEHEIINYIFNSIFNSNNEIVLCDMGTTLNINDRMILKKHTTYYKAPEIILDLDYNGKYDYWSLGCTIYEMITGDILFNPFDFELQEKFGENEDRNLLYLIISTLGISHNEIINKSKLKEVFFTSDNEMLKGFDSISHNSILNRIVKKNIISNDDLCYNLNYNSNIDKLLLMIYSYIKFDPNDRK